MKPNPLTCLAATLLVGAGSNLNAQTPPIVHEWLRQLAPVVGDWHASWTGEAGQPGKGTVRIQPVLGGVACTLDFTVFSQDGEAVFASKGIFHWQPESGSLACTVVESDGTCGVDVLVKRTAEGSVWHGSRRLPTGQRLTQVQRVRYLTKDSFTVEYTDQLLDGERLPASVKYIMTRVTATTEQVLRDLGGEWDAAYMNRDLATLRRLLAEDYVSIDEMGEALNKAQDLEIVRSGEYILKAAKEDEPAKVRILGDTAVVHWTGTVTQEYRGQDTSGRFRTTTVWVKRDGRWQVLSWQASKLRPL